MIFSKIFSKAEAAFRFRLAVAALCGSICALVFLSVFESSASGQDSGRPLQGDWGGHHARLILTETGGQADFDCAHGSIAEPFLVDAGGKFDLKGIFVYEHGGPISRNEKAEEHPARYTGSTDGKEMTLNVAILDLKQSIGPFTLSLGKPARLHKCLSRRRPTGN